MTFNRNSSSSTRSFARPSGPATPSASATPSAAQGERKKLVTITGNLGKVENDRGAFSQKGQYIWSTSIAVTTWDKEAKEERTEWVKIVGFDGEKSHEKMASVLQQTIEFVRANTADFGKITITGLESFDNYTDKQGQDRTSRSVTLNRKDSLAIQLKVFIEDGATPSGDVADLFSGTQEDTPADFTDVDDIPF